MKKRYPTRRLPPPPSLTQNLSRYVVRHTRAPQVNSSAPSHCNPPPRAPSQSTHPMHSVTHALAHTHTHTHTNTHTHSDAVSTRSIAPSVGSYATARTPPTLSCELSPLPPHASMRLCLRIPHAMLSVIPLHHKRTHSRNRIASLPPGPHPNPATTYTYTYIHTHIHTYTHTHTHIHSVTHTYTQTHIHTYTHTRPHTACRFRCSPWR